MFNWAKQTLANVVGTEEPIYGPTAIRAVGKQPNDPEYTELTRKDLKWIAMESTCVETQTFYVHTEQGHIALVQVIYNNVAGLRTTCQFNTKVFYPDRKAPILWSSDPLSNYGFDEDKVSFHADGCSVELSEDGSFYSIKSVTNENSLVNLKFTRVAPGFVVGKDGITEFGTDPMNPWGSMRHAFWPRCTVEGTIITKNGDIDCKGRGFFVHALQGMKPHHAAARWNFVNFQGPTYSAILMEYTTPPSYGSTKVQVGGVATDGKILFAGTNCGATHTTTTQDAENDWPVPSAASYHWEGKTSDGQAVSADMSGSLGERLDRVDVMAEVPGFIKTIVATAAGTKPYIYMFAPKMTLKVKTGEEVKEEETTFFTEAVFIS
ncbi:oxidative stress survival, Svf1-like protein [Delitschia confertaspora ATCC 74209]|uniref:Ceramide-binding protein SVF1 n=1 Tax=Delitschia confertaspora ATCC 74209 TaxID=1513339 RepID=A0A9P4JLC2_9PLEO|nr:oxidative stress survival, Svf1-like protein [Delitschia confertaspora ATCC 74209]